MSDLLLDFLKGHDRILPPIGDREARSVSS
jgi:hypothetical protein